MIETPLKNCLARQIEETIATLVEAEKLNPADMGHENSGINYARALGRAQAKATVARIELQTLLEVFLK